MPFISLTRLRLRHWRYFPAFIFYAIRTKRQAERAPGNHGVAVLNDAHLAFWTCTAWTDEAAMRAYMLSDPHKSVMPKLAGWCDEAATTHWTQESPALPTWTEAHRRLTTQGRRSRVKHPTPAHESLQFPVPRE